MRGTLACVLALCASVAWAFGVSASEPGSATAGMSDGGFALAGAGAAGPGIVMRVRLSARSPLRFNLDQDAVVMDVRDDVLARDVAFGKSFTTVLGGPGAGDDAYEVEIGRFRRVDDALGLRAVLAASLPYEDKVRYVPHIVADGTEWVFRVGGTGDPDALHKLSAALARVGIQRGFAPVPVLVRPAVSEKARLSTADGPFEVRAGELPGEIVLLTSSGATMSFVGGGVRVAPRDSLEIGFTVGGVRYKGELEIRRKDSWDGKVELVAINRIDIESYVEGVLAGEVYPSWEMEALKAQAVAARTYALYRKATTSGRDYDVDDTVAYQKYSGGHAIESFRRAVAETRGEVVTYQGDIINAHYFASGGGTTEDDEDVWPGGEDEPYLEAVADFDQASPHYVWQNPPALWAPNLLAKLGLQPQFPARIEPALVSGEKVLSYRFSTPSASVTLTREEIRRKVGLKSPRFTIRVVGPEETGIVVPSEAPDAPGGGAGPDRTARDGTPPVDGTGGTAEPGLPAVSGCVAVREDGSTKGYVVSLGRNVVVQGKAVGPGCAGELESAGTLVIIDGVGYGHGVGLSQWGAQGMASMRDERGNPVYSYVDILKHYYPGTEVVANYNLPVLSPTVPTGSAEGSAVSGADVRVETSPPDDAGELEPCEPLGRD
ncbi:MAG TPA: SpoIID/LytB domain-containing protein [Firmicutes bacterium]|nr:SpoIID/LytB domain-containing protein [Bacillota bacterium]